MKNRNKFALALLGAVSTISTTAHAAQFVSFVGASGAQIIDSNVDQYQDNDVVNLTQLEEFQVGSRIDFGGSFASAGMFIYDIVNGTGFTMSGGARTRIVNNAHIGTSGYAFDYGFIASAGDVLTFNYNVGRTSGFQDFLDLYDTNTGNFIQRWELPANGDPGTIEYALDGGRQYNLAFGNILTATRLFGVGAQDDESLYTLSFANGGVPEPATWAMMIAGFGFVGGAMRKANQGRKALAT